MDTKAAELHKASMVMPLLPKSVKRMYNIIKMKYQDDRSDIARKLQAII